MYTVEDAIEHIGFGPFQIVVTLFTGMIWVSQSVNFKEILHSLAIHLFVPAVIRCYGGNVISCIVSYTEV